MIKLLSFLCALFGIFSITLTNIEVIGGNFGSHFQFILSGNTDELIQASDNEKIKILIGEDEKETLCFIEETQPEQLAYYSCIYTERIDINAGSQIYLKKDQDNIFGLSDNLLIKPISLTFADYEVNYLQLKDSSLEFNLKATILLIGNIKYGMIFYLDIKDDISNKLSECQIGSEEKILGIEYYISKCIINDINKNALSEVNITKSSPIQGTVSFYPKLKADINIASFKSLNFLSSSDLKFNSNNKWEFNIKLQKNYIMGANALIDIFYNGEESTAFCKTIKKMYFIVFLIKMSNQNLI